MIRSFANVYDNTLILGKSFSFLFHRRTDSKSEQYFLCEYDTIQRRTYHRAKGTIVAK